ncbi:MAG: FKBP-type peptidyl-prolyl cis-trans isomerase [Acidobacteriota bacterium]|nr:FKBP-type peptidyl-prolyl cis-trans isomerase [Acidobacteriota bacterium]MDH3784107.1 FKBP-type peptidyl-prolyl cis-trans isomerase [Acidobacteriota bacterium]
MRRHGVTSSLFLLFLSAAITVGVQGAEPPRRGKLTLKDPGSLRNSGPGSKQIPPPDNLLDPPADAKQSSERVRYVHAVHGDGDRSIGPNDRIWLKYSAWTPDGTTLGTTDGRAHGRRLDVHSLMSGLSALVQRCRVGDKVQAWLPASATAMRNTMALDVPVMIEFEIEHARFAPPSPEPLRMPRRKSKHGVQQSETGLSWLVVERPDDGVSPQGDDMVLADFAVWNRDGVLLDSTVLDGKAANFEIDATVPVFAESFATMVPGERRTLWAPKELAGEFQSIGIHSQGDLIIDVIMIQVMSRPDVPVDVFMAPTQSAESPLGVPYRILADGHGTRHPRKGDRVEIIYAGWTSDGTMFDSSYSHGRAGVFKLGQQTPIGWNDVVFRMVEGEKRRMWIPEALAYAGAEGRPEGNLVFDVELIRILEDDDPGVEVEDGPESRRR